MKNIQIVQISLIVIIIYIITCYILFLKHGHEGKYYSSIWFKILFLPYKLVLFLVAPVFMLGFEKRLFKIKFKLDSDYYMVLDGDYSLIDELQQNNLRTKGKTRIEEELAKRRR